MVGCDLSAEFAVWNWDVVLNTYVRELTDLVACVALGRKLVEGFIPQCPNNQSL